MPKPEKVYIVGPTESILTQRGNRHPSLASYLVKQGYALEYVTSDFYHAEKRWFSREEIRLGQEKVPYKLTVKRCIGYKTNISVRRVISNALLSLSFFVYLFPRLNKRTALILPSRPVEMIFAAALLRLLRRTCVLLDIQDVWPDGFASRDKGQLRVGLFRVYCNTFLYPSLRFINKEIHVAPSFVNWLQRYHPRGRSMFVPLGYDVDRWVHVSFEQNHCHHGPVRLVCVAMLQNAIDVMPILEAIEADERFHLTLIGEDGKGERYPEVNAYIKNKRMQNVAMIGRVKPETMWEYLQCMDIGVVPMLSSSIPNKVFDYIAAYLPIIVLGENDSADLVRKLEIGWSCPYNCQGVSGLLARIDRKVIQKKRAGVRMVRDTFSRDNLHSIIQRVLEEDDAIGATRADVMLTATNEKSWAREPGTRALEWSN